MCSIHEGPTKQSKANKKAHSFSSASPVHKLNEVNFKDACLKLVCGIILPMIRGKGKEQV